jgi:hypothetical protein
MCVLISDFILFPNFQIDQSYSVYKTRVILQYVILNWSKIYVALPQTKKNKLRGLSLRTDSTDSRLSAKLVPTFADRGVFPVF